MRALSCLEVAGLRQHRIQFVKLRFERVVVGESSRAFHLADERIKRAVRMLRRAKIAQARVRLVGDPFKQRCGQPRFADSGLAGEQHHLTLAGL